MVRDTNQQKRGERYRRVVASRVCSELRTSVFYEISKFEIWIAEIGRSCVVRP